MTDVIFEIAALEAFHVALGDKSYWRNYRSDNRHASARYVLKQGWRTAYGRTVETCIVKVTLADGSSGWGEATEPICPEAVAILATELIAPLAAGITFPSVSAFRDFAYDLNRGRGHLSGYLPLAVAAMDMAICDALAKARGEPLARMHNRQALGRFDIYLSGIRRGTREERAQFLAELLANGLGAVKVFVDGDLSQTIAEIEYLRARSGSGWQLMVDALWSLEGLDDARRLRRTLAPYDVAWLECPLVPEDIAGHRALCEESGVPIALGEHFFTHWQLRDWLDGRCLHIFQPDIGRTGFNGGMAMAAMAKAAGIAVTPHMGTGSALVQAAALQFYAAACGSLPCEYQFDLAGALPDVFRSDWRYEAGSMRLPPTPGLGVAVDEDRLRHHAISCMCYNAP